MHVVQPPPNPPFLCLPSHRMCKISTLVFCVLLWLTWAAPLLPLSKLHSLEAGWVWGLVWGWQWAQLFGTREYQSISRGELPGVLHTLLTRVPTDRLVVVLDSE